MKKPKIPQPFLLLLFLSTILNASLFAQSIEDDISALASKEYPEGGPGVSILVAKNGKPIYKEAFGMASIELNVAMKPDNVFEIGSITKQFTAIAVLMLKEQGKLKLEDDITKFLPDYPTHGKSITIHHLLNHTSGIKSYTDMPSFIQEARTDFTPQELIDTFKNEPMDFEPGEKFRYNNSGYILLGYIIEKASGETYEDFIDNHIFKPLGMSSSYYGSNLEIIMKRASGYQQVEQGFANSNYISMTIPYAAGSLMSTTTDLLKWQNALNSYKLITNASYELAIHGSTLNNGEHIDYGYGLSEMTIQGSQAISHGGGIFGYTTMGIYFPKEDIFVSALSNCSCKNVTGLANKIAAIAIGKPLPNVKDAITLNETQLNKWLGAYQFENDIVRHITLDEGKLYSQREGSTKLPIFPLSENQYLFEDVIYTYDFFEEDGVKKVTFKSPSNTQIGIFTNKLPPAERKTITLTEKEIEPYVGKYELMPGFILTFTKNGNKLFTQATGQPQFEVFPESKDTFFLKVVEAKIIFKKDTQGKITSLDLHQNGVIQNAKKIE
ncbi:serine hydrolase [Mangrovimonas sp. ST2L15]|uniref:serine hydrolase n=1 Tax=Mangrovimonas sp. ST2L15 TaxID=1645916 RepID=UPI0006B6993C|nr:serine hydrolase [Mangrovimonas sp. ST2L15]